MHVDKCIQIYSTELKVRGIGKGFAQKLPLLSVPCLVQREYSHTEVILNRPPD